MHKAKKFQPLAVLNQKLKGLDVFESNDAPTPPPITHSASSSTTHLVHEPSPVRRDPEEEVTRSHWQRLGYRDVCSDPLCARPITGSQMALGGSQPAVNCRQCGRLFCEEHTMYQMKLSRQAKHDPVRGIWCRVCETCYKSRDGYNHHHGYERDHFDEFANIRRKRVDRERMEVSRLEKRLTKLTQLLANPPPPEEVQTSGSWFSLSGVGAKNHRKALEQSIITWEDDAKVTNCPFCQQEFSTYTFRRHHCRMCGRVVCGDPKTECSTEIGLNVAAGTSKSESCLISTNILQGRINQRRSAARSALTSACARIASTHCLLGAILSVHWPRSRRTSAHTRTSHSTSGVFDCFYLDSTSYCKPYRILISHQRLSSSQMRPRCAGG